MEKILVLDFGGQYNQLIARRVRECGVYCEVKPYTTPLEQLKAMNPIGIIFTGGPNSVYDPASPQADPEIFKLGIPILGICYGCQLISWMVGGNVETAEQSEYGKIDLTVTKKQSEIFADVDETSVVWMSHTDRVKVMPSGFEITAKTEACPIAAYENEEKKIYGVQFHPEVTHTQFGFKILHNFLYNVCGCHGDWKMERCTFSVGSPCRVGKARIWWQGYGNPVLSDRAGHSHTEAAVSSPGKRQNHSGRLLAGGIVCAVGLHPD